ncbi:ECF transporter S component [Enterococcus lemanii]|jgi:riboflavin transporter FmnP|uniref:Riboflavin transporter n=1 Tax=Enterococcus lemanii TaxID=1159752 RepID=A0ABV9MUX8_9ENTE|nr:ECF transporter S component [Enterococcus lemanii]MBM7709355.1 riboflavin transporter FmnP [Enterococcus lemanii]NLM66838.1 ECF transporter S component [Enterococcus sp.]
MNNKVQKMVSISMFAAMGLVMQFVSFPILPLFPFLKVDFSDIPVLLSMFLFGPFAGVATAFLRSLLHTTLTGLSPQNLVGDVASFIATTTFTLPIYYFFRKDHGKTNKIFGIINGVLAMSIVMAIANYFVITPLYLTFFGVTADQFLGMSLANYVVIGILPFNLLKGTLVSAVFLVLHAKLLPWLARKKQISHHQTF